MLFLPLSALLASACWRPLFVFKYSTTPTVLMLSSLKNVAVTETIRRLKLLPRKMIYTTISFQYSVFLYDWNISVRYPQVQNKIYMEIKSFSSCFIDSSVTKFSIFFKETLQRVFLGSHVLVNANWVSFVILYNINSEVLIYSFSCMFTVFDVRERFLPRRETLYCSMFVNLFNGNRKKMDNSLLKLFFLL